MPTLHATSPWRGNRAGRRRYRSLTLLAAACALPFSLSACKDNLARVYTARPYQADPGCVDAYVPLGVVYAEYLRATCDPTCLLQDDQLYVSSVCAPYPDRAAIIAPEDSAECAAALEAFAQDLSCEAALGNGDVGSSDEPPPSDAEAPDGG